MKNLIAFLLFQFLIISCDKKEPTPTPTPTDTTFTVSYDKNGATGESPVDTKKYKKSENVSVSGKGVLTNGNLVFVSWNTQANGSGTDYFAGSTLENITANVTLFAIWKEKFIAGTLLNNSLIGSSSHDNIAKSSDFGMLTVTSYWKWNIYKPKVVQANPYVGLWDNSTPDYSTTDNMVNFAFDNGKKLHGHPLLYQIEAVDPRNKSTNAESPDYNINYGVPDWVVTAGKDKAEGILKKHITDVCTRYKGKVFVWDVVNEAIKDINTDGKVGDYASYRYATATEEDHYRDGWWKSSLGGFNYLKLAFQTARAADPAAQLIYNDYRIEGNENRPKFDVVKAMMIKIKTQTNAIDGLGWQVHVSIANALNPAWLAEWKLRMNEIADAGFDNYITEMDLVLGSSTLEQQKQAYFNIVNTFKSAKRTKYVMVWGIADEQNGNWRQFDQPLLFNKNWEKKPAYFGFFNALNGLTIDGK
jgi:endo-1,4-beta-xylanase